MRAEAIFVPMGVLALWTGLMVLMTAVRRITAVRRGRLKAAAFALGESRDVPEDVSLPNRNLMNLLEMPVLFYVVSLASHAARQVTPGLVVMAWAYVALRVAHSLVHITTNRISRRLMLFAASNFVLLAMWIRFLTRVV